MKYLHLILFQIIIGGLICLFFVRDVSGFIIIPVLAGILFPLLLHKRWFLASLYLAGVYYLFTKHRSYSDEAIAILVVVSIYAAILWGIWSLWDWYLRREISTDPELKWHSKLIEKQKTYTDNLYDWNSSLRDLIAHGDIKETKKTRAYQASAEKMKSLDKKADTYSSEFDSSNSGAYRIGKTWNDRKARSRGRSALRKMESVVDKLKPLYNKIKSTGVSYVNLDAKCIEKRKKENEEKDRKERLANTKLQQEAEVRKEQLRLEAQKRQAEAQHHQEKEMAEMKAKGDIEKEIAETEKELALIRERREAEAFLRNKEQETTKMLLELERLKNLRAQSSADRYKHLKDLLED